MHQTLGRLADLAVRIATLLSIRVDTLEVPHLLHKDEPHVKRPLMIEDLNVIQYQSEEVDNTFITSDGTSPYNSTR